MKTGMIMLAGVPLASMAMMVAGCATMISGTTQEMSFQSSPEGVIVTLIRAVPDEDYWAGKAAKDAGKKQPTHDETRILGKTPFTLQLDKAEDQSVVFSKEGFKPLTMKLTTQTDPNFWGNIVFGGFVGSTTDSMSGAIYQFSPSQYFVTLVPDLSTPVEHATLQSQRDKALAFIVRRYPSLMANLSQGIGEDWSALMGLLHIGPGQEADARQKIRALAMVYSDIATFATHVTDLYLK